MKYNQPPYSRRAIKSIANCLMKYHGYSREEAKRVANQISVIDKSTWMAQKSHKNPRRRGVYSYVVMSHHRDDVLFIQCGKDSKPQLL